jgi:hypothetical protein
MPRRSKYFALLYRCTLDTLVRFRGHGVRLATVQYMRQTCQNKRLVYVWGQAGHAVHPGPASKKTESHLQYISVHLGVGEVTEYFWAH